MFSPIVTRPLFALLLAGILLATGNVRAEDAPEEIPAPLTSEISLGLEESDRPLLPTMDAPPPEVLIFKNGDRLTGQSLNLSGNALEWRRQDGQMLLVPLEEIEKVEVSVLPLVEPQSPTELGLSEWTNPNTLTPDHVFGEPGGGLPYGLISDIPVVGGAISIVGSAYSGAQSTVNVAKSAAVFWTNRIQVGGNFTSGNQNINIFDVLLTLERSTPVSMRQAEMGGNWASNAGNRTSNRWWINANFDWPLFDGERNWIAFLSSKNEYNQMAGLDYRGTDSPGIGYRFYNEPKRRLIARLGPAVTTEIFHGAGTQRTTFDLFAELESRIPLSDRLNLEHKFRIQPNLLDSSLYRIFTTTALMMDLDKEKTWKLSLNCRTEYISVPSPGKKPTDYFTVLSLVYQRK